MIRFVMKILCSTLLIALPVNLFAWEKRLSSEETSMKTYKNPEGGVYVLMYPGLGSPIRDYMMLSIKSDGQVNNSFGVQGWANFGRVNDVAIAENGQIWVLGRGTLSLYDDAGVKISTFGNEGTVNLGKVFPERLLLLADHMILLGSKPNSQANLSEPYAFKMDLNGSFMGVSRTYPSLTETSGWIEAGMHPDGGFYLVTNGALAGGDPDPSSSTTRVAITKINADLSIDENFAQGGSRYHDEVWRVGVEDIVVDSEGSAYYALHPGNAGDTLIAKMLNNGMPDMTFGDAGYFHMPFTETVAHRLRLNSEEGLNVSCANWVEGMLEKTESCALRLDSEGNIDEAFGNQGIVSRRTGDGHNYMSDMIDLDESTTLLVFDDDEGLLLETMSR